MNQVKVSLHEVLIIFRKSCKLPLCLSANIEAEAGLLFPMSHQIGSFSHSVCCPSLVLSDKKKKVLIFVNEIAAPLTVSDSRDCIVSECFHFINIILPYPASLTPQAAGLLLRQSGTFQSNDIVQQKHSFNHCLY